MEWKGKLTRRNRFDEALNNNELEMGDFVNFR